MERGGNVRFRVIESLTAKSLWAALREQVKQDARLITNESTAYTGLGCDYAGGHHNVNHTKGEYARGEVHINTIGGMPSAFSLIKRGMYGTSHSVSKRHLHRYLARSSSSAITPARWTTGSAWLWRSECARVSA